jgi:hypothetical protein
VSDLSLVILAAGVGSRYGGLKQLDEVGPAGETLMEYSIYDALRAGFRRVVLVVRPETEDEFRDGLGRRIDGRMELAFVHQTLDDLPDGRMPPEGRTKPWGTGQAVLAAAQAVPGPFAVINADDYYGAASYRSLAGFLDDVGPAAAEFALQGFEIGPTLSPAGAVSRGLCRVDSEGRLRAIVEVLEVVKDGDGGRYLDGTGRDRHLRGDEPVSMNMWGFTPAVFELLRQAFSRFLDGSGSDPAAEFMLPAAVQSFIDAGRARVSVLTESGTWCGITYRQDRRRVVSFMADLIEQGVYPWDLWGPESR